FGTIDNADTITGTTINGTTGINTGAGAGTQRIDASGNLVNIGNLTGTGAVIISATNAALTLQTTVSGNIVVNGAGSLDVQDATTFASTVTLNGVTTANTDVDLTLAGTENLAITSDLAGTVNVLSLVATPSASAGTTRGFFIQQANSANTNGLDAGLYIDNADTNLAIPAAISIQNSGGGGYTTVIDNAGTLISGAELNLLDTRDAALVDINDAVNTAITATGPLDGGSITSNFGSINTGADNITTTGTVFGNSLDRSTAGTLSIGNTNATAVELGGASVVSTALGGLTVTTGKNLTVNGDAFTDLTGNGLQVSTGALTIQVAASADALSATTSSGSGLEVLASGVTLLQGCGGGQVLAWNETSDIWACTDQTGGVTTLQGAYDGSATPAVITLATGKNLEVNSPDVATDPNIIFDLQCATCSAGGGQFKVQNANTDVLTIKNNSSSTSAFTFQPATNSTIAFEIQNAVGSSNLFIADTTNTRIGIAKTDPAYTLDVAGDVNITGAYRISGTSICTSSGCTPASGSSNYIQNQSASNQSASFRVSGTGRANTALQAPLFDRADAGVLAIGTTNATSITLDQDTSVAAGKSFTAAGAATFQKSADSTTAFQIQNAAGNSNLLVADTTNTKLGIATAPSSSGAALQVSGSASATTGFDLSASGNSSSTITKLTTVSTAVTANDVVIIDTVTAGKVKTTSTLGATGVFGIATTTNSSDVAQKIVIGGVYQVTADTAAVAIGDQLVTSSTTGQVTPTSNPSIGTSIGRALSSKASGSSGTVWVQVTPGSGGSSGSGGMTKLYDTTLGASAASFDIQNIPSGYDHLELKWTFRGDEATTWNYSLLRFNNDSGSNYNYNYLYDSSSGSGHASNASATSGRFGGYLGTSASSNRFMSGTTDIVNYANSSNQKSWNSTVSGLSWNDTTADQYSTFSSGIWRDTSAVNRITILPTSGNFVAGSRVTLYGIGPNSGGTAAGAGAGEMVYTEFNSDKTITATTEGAANTVVTSSSYTYDGSTPILVQFWAPYVTRNASAQLTYVLLRDSTVLGQWKTGYLTSSDFPPAYLQFKETPSNGSHTYTVKAFIDSGTNAVIKAGSGGSGALMPGYVRVIPANGSGNATTLQGAYDMGRQITTTDARDFQITLADTTTDSNAIINVASGSTSKFAVQAAGADSFSVSASGAVLAKNSANSTAAFQIQNSSADVLFTANTTNNRIKIGNDTGTDTATTTLVLDNATADPTTNVVNGATYYNSSTHKFRCYVNSAWQDCGSAGDGVLVSKTIGSTSTSVDQYDVVVIDTAEAGEVKRATTFGDNRVYGVNQTSGTTAAGGSITVKTAGESTVNVDTAAVAIGDFLVTSSTTGRATPSSNPAIGTVIGRAMSSKAAGSNGTVTVQVTPGMGGSSNTNGGMTKLYDTTLGADTATFDVTNIPSGYDNLLVYASVRSTAGAVADYPKVKVNNDSGTNYVEFAYEMAAGSSAVPNYPVNNMTSMFANATLRVAADTATANFFSPIQFNFYNYANTSTYKSAMIDTVASDYTTVNFMDKGWSTWRNTAAINQLTFALNSGNFKAGSRLTVYGVGGSAGTISGSQSAGAGEISYTQFTSDVSVTATTEATANTIVTAPSYTYDGNTPIVVQFYAYSTWVSSAANNYNHSFYLYDGSSSIGRMALNESIDNFQKEEGPIFATYRITPSAGSHTYSIRAATSGGTLAIGAGAGGNGNSVPGYIRITPATGSGNATTLQGAYDMGRTITTTDARDIQVTLADTTTDSNAIINVASGSTSQFQVQYNGTNVFRIANAAGDQGAALFQNAGNSTTAFQIQNAAGTQLFIADTDNSRVYIGDTDADDVGTILVLDTKTGAADPTGVNGGIYYNSNSNKFRCYQNGGWTDCVSAGTVTNLQTAYNGSTSPEITVDGTRGAVTIQDASSPIAANLLEVNANGGGSTYFAVDSSGAKTTNLKLTPTGNSSSTITKSTVVTGTVAANDVLVIDTATAGQVKRATVYGSTGVFGIATSSGTPQDIVIGGVYQVTADTAAVAIGDWLVTSSTTGQVTPSSNPSIGTSIGRALSAKAAGSSGLVWVQVTPGAGGSSGTGGMTKLYDTTLGADTASFDITNIPSGYSDIKVIASLRGTAVASYIRPQVTFNGDSAANYAWAGAQTSSITDSAGYWIVPAANTDANVFSATEITVTDYLAAKYKGVKVSSGFSSKQTGVYADYTVSGGSWYNTAAINRITVAPASGNWLAGSRLEVYGIGPGGGNTAAGAGAGEIGYQEFTSNVTVTATTEGTANTVVTAPAYTFDGTTPYLIEFFAQTTYNNVEFVLYDGSSSIGLFRGANPGYAGDGPKSLSRRITPSAGSHTYSIRAFTSSGSHTVYAGAGGVGNTVPGYIRITPATGSGNATTLQGAYDMGRMISTTDARDIAFNLEDTTTDSHFVVNTKTSSTSKFATQYNGTDTFKITNAAAAQGSALFQNAANNTTAFQIQNAAGTALFVADTSNNRIYIGNPTADSTGVLLVLDTKNTAGDPTGVAGGLYYNSNSASIRAYQNGAWSGLNGSIGTSFPANPEDGDEYTYVADGTNGVYWHFIYRSATSKWIFTGGAPLVSEVTTSESTSSGTYTALATAGPSITLPFAGDYDVKIEVLAGNQGGTSAAPIMSYDIGATGAVDADGTNTNGMYVGDTRGGYWSAERRKTGLGAVTLTAKYKANSGAAVYFGNRRMLVWPIQK
ncbi:DUF2190 family protein, partial [Candidatus Saccharibacteria bacterium]|nr:DUF2190 family protein [Candidatus Saccharibacteria bacterium]